MRGLIVASSYGIYKVVTNQKEYNVKPRGVFRHHSIKPCVGDYVEFDEIEGVITTVEERKNYLIRPTISNVDEIAIVMSFVEPKYSSLLINKFISYVNYYHIKANVIITKCDRCTDSLELENIVNNLKNMGINVFTFSKISLQGKNEIIEQFKNKVVVLMGQTGAGKSSLLNALVPGINREVGEYSKALGRGKHKTKEVVMIPFFSGYIADTPGFSSLELPFYKEDLARYFPMFEELSKNCKYDDCLHYNARDCAILKAVEDKLISKENYEDYLVISNELKHRKDRY